MMSRIMRDDEARELFGELLEQVDGEGPILVQREGDKPAVLILSLGQPGRAGAAGRADLAVRIEELLETLQGQPGNAAAQGQPGRAAAQGQPGRAAADAESGSESVADQLRELLEALQGQPGRA